MQPTEWIEEDPQRQKDAVRSGDFSLQWKGNRLGVKILKDVNKADQTFPVVPFVGEQLALKGLLAIEGDPGKLAAMVIEKPPEQDRCPGRRLSW